MVWVFSFRPLLGFIFCLMCIELCRDILVLKVFVQPSWLCKGPLRCISFLSCVKDQLGGLGHIQDDILYGGKSLKSFYYLV